MKAHLQRFRLAARLTTLPHMRLRLFLLIFVSVGALLALPAAASAYFVHVVAPGESLSSIAAQDGLTVDQLAAANGLSPDAQLIVGSTVQIPPQASGASGAPVSSSTDSASAGDGDTDADDSGSSAAPSGSYVVQPGDTLSAIAARAGMSVNQLAALNGLNPNAYLISGTAISLPGAPATVNASSDTGSSTVGGGSYVVQPGDTLSAIAARAGMSVEPARRPERSEPQRVPDQRHRDQPGRFRRHRVRLSGRNVIVRGGPAGGSCGGGSADRPALPDA